MSQVRLNGTFPSWAYVWFGDQPGTVINAGPYAIDVLTPIRADAGPADITLMRQDGGVLLTVPGGFAFTDGSSASPGGPSPTPSEPTPTPTDPPTPGDPGPTDPTPGAPGPAPTDPSPTTTSAPPTTTTAPSPSPGNPGDSPAPAPSDPGTTPAPTTTVSSGGPDSAPTTTTAPSQRRPRLGLGDPVDRPSGLRGRVITSGLSLDTAVLCQSDPCSLD